MSTEINAGTSVFTDRHGRAWDVTLTMLSARRVAASDFSELTQIEIDFLNPTQHIFAEVAKKPSLAMAIVWAIIQPQVVRDVLNPVVESAADHPETVRKYPTDEEAFIDSLGGAALKEAKEALWDSMLNFFHDQRTILLRWREIERQTQRKLTEKIEQVIPQMQETMDRLLDQGVDDAVKEFNDSTKHLLSPASSDSVQASSGR